jgi:tetratricopeptide (TPR) repeat protein
MAETDFKYDVFVSYSSANKEWVRKTFVPILEKAGLEVCDYYRDFDVGAPIVMEMERAILESRKTIPVLSPAYLKSGWTEFESLMVQTTDAANRNRNVLPVMLEKCELPLRIKYMNCINFANPDDVDIEWERFSRALGVTLSPSLLDTKSPDTGSRDIWHLAHPYPMPPNFTGRAIELKMLDDWLADNNNRLFILRALGGFGKSALAWQWINTHVNPAEWRKLVWWSFYEGDASFEHFIEETLKYLKLDVPQGQRPQVEELLKAMQGQKILLIMDGFERALRAYSSMNAAYQGDEEPKLEDNQLDCVNINAQIFLLKVCSLPNMASKVLMTTRLTPRAVKIHDELLQSCREEKLEAMQKADAVEFFYKQKIKGTHAEIEAACAPYGYHPLSLRLLAGRILKDFEKPADIVVAQKLKIDGDIIQQKHHVLKVSYNSLPLHEQKLLSTIACFRSPVELKTLQSIAEGNETLNGDLHDLVARGLLHFDDKNKKFDLHPIVRHFAYDRLIAPERTGVHVTLIVYFEAVPQPQKIEKLEDLAPVIELYHHMVKAGKLDEAFDLFYTRLNEPLYYQLGAYQVFIELQAALFDEKTQLPKLEKESRQARILNDIANSYFLSGQPRRAVPLFEMQNALQEKAGNKQNLAAGLGNVAQQQLVISALREAERNLRRAIELDKEVESEYDEASDRMELGRVLSYRGVWQEAKKELNESLDWLKRKSTFKCKA